MIPGMTYELADAILDFIDDDETSRTNGCESEYYNGLQPSYSSKNSPLESLDELLLVRGVSSEYLYGEDFNRNGLLDPNENDGDVTWPPDNADGVAVRLVRLPQRSWPRDEHPLGWLDSNQHQRQQPGRLVRPA